MSPETKTSRILLLLILAAALVLGLTGIRWGLPGKTLTLSTYHPDESFMFQVFENIHQTRSLHPGKMGLLYGTFYFYLSGFFLFLAKAAGLIQIGSREFLLENLANVDRMYLTVRLFSVLCGVGSVAALYFLARRIGNAATGLWAAFFMAFAPVAIAVNHYAKVDALLPLLITALLWAVFDLHEKKSLKSAIACGVLSGLLASTKYNAGVFLLTPLFALWTSASEEKIKMSAWICLAALLSFLAATPYALLDFPLFLDCIREQFGMLGGSGLWEAGYKNGFWRYLSYYIPFGMGWTAALLSYAGFFLAALYIVRKGENEGLLKIILFGFATMFFLLGRSGHRTTSLSAPLVPFLALFAALAMAAIRKRAGKTLFALCAFSILAAHILYGTAFARLYAQPNTRELAEEWIQNNVPRETTVGIIRSYFWTPGLLRQAHPPYPLSKAGDDRTGFHTSVLGLKDLRPLPVYFLASEMETREYARLEKQEPQYAAALRDFLAHYDSVAVFELKPRAGPLVFWKRTVPWDLAAIAPAQVIYKLKPETEAGKKL